MSEKDLGKVLTTDYPRVEEVTERMVCATKDQSLSMRGSVRLMTSRLSTSKENEERRRQALRPFSK